jgi:hypothetical protein
MRKAPRRRATGRADHVEHDRAGESFSSNRKIRQEGFGERVRAQADVGFGDDERHGVVALVADRHARGDAARGEPVGELARRDDVRLAAG